MCSILVLSHHLVTICHKNLTFFPFYVAEVLRAQLDLNKSAGPDDLGPFFLRSAANFITVPLCHIFNLTISDRKIPDVWKSASMDVLLLLKAGDPSDFNNYRPKVLENLVSGHFKNYLDKFGLLAPQHDNCCY